MPLPNPTPARTALTTDHLETLRADARSNRYRFVDPTRLPSVRHTLAQLPTIWIDHVLGRATTGCGTIALQWGEMVTLEHAAKLDRDHLDHLATRRQEDNARRENNERSEQHRRDVDRRQRHTLPVDVFVGLNWAFGYENGSNRGRSHIVVQHDLRSGRLHRPAATALCETPSRTGGGAWGLNPLRALDRTPRDAVGPGDHDRLPDCRACLAIADRIAKRQPCRPDAQ